ncbi:MAG TPA: hypothetical protein VE820_10755 [Sphingomicrobium sp.]|jgi:hypothetical protein|nr:hypothetical protein [Sphingomicrobium sp.]
MTGRNFLAATALAVGLISAAGGASPAKKAPPAAPSKPDPKAEQLLQSCDAHKFETTVKEVVDGTPQQSKVKLCGKEGQSDADWIGTLKDAVAKLDANKDMPAEVRDQIVKALKNEISRLEFQGAKTAFTSARPETKSSPLDEIAALPPLPQAKPQAIASAPPPAREITPRAPLSDYAALPPLPSSTVPPPSVLAAGASTSVVFLPRPKISFSCFTPGEGADGPCTGFTRDTLVTVLAGEDLPASTAVRFVRDGDPKADVALAQLKKGKSMQFAIPTDVCKHAVGGRLELKIVRSGQEVGTDGPYNLNC